MTSTRKGINSFRLRTVYKRQANPGWNQSYQPAILATPQEAPSVSRAYILTPDKLEGREVHILSTPERNAVLLGFYHPHVVGLQEQRMLSPEPCPHPLWTFQGMNRTNLPALKGIIDVADRLGYLRLLKRVKVPNSNSPGGYTWVVFPWFGDLLWAIKTPSGDLFNVNWTIKDSHADFMRSFRDRTKIKTMTTKALARHEIERAYYEDAAIRTVQVTNDSINSHVAANLRQLFLHHRRYLGLTAEQRAEMLRKFSSALESGVPPSDVILELTRGGRFSVYQCRSRFYQAIWRRELRIDLFKPILIDRPQNYEEQDVLEVYADWFKRG